MRRFPLGKDAFKYWLESMEGKVVSDGRRRYCSYCPLATYLRSIGHERVDVFTTFLAVDGKEYTLPQWASKFVMAFDEQTKDQVCNKASTALKVLNSLK